MCANLALGLPYTLFPHVHSTVLVSRASRGLQLLIRVKSKGFNYGFIEYDDPGAAERAMATLNGRRVHQAVSFES